MLVLLDSKPLGMVTNPNASTETDECNDWLESLLNKDVAVLVPEIIDYELRRELIRIGSDRSVAKLDSLAHEIGYLRLDSETLQIAAALWAETRNRGLGTAAENRLDIDCILAAHARRIVATYKQIRIATTDLDDLPRYDTDNIKALHWRDIT